MGRYSRAKNSLNPENAFNSATYEIGTTVAIITVSLTIGQNRIKIMPQLEDFDTNVYFGIAADNLLTNLGSKAHIYADEAIKKMHAIGDDEGFDMWLGIQRHLAQKATADLMGDNITIH